MRRTTGALVAVGVLGLLLLVGGYEYVFAIAERTVSFQVTDKAVVATGHGHKYLIYTNHGTFRDGDNLWHAKFSSSDLYGAIRVGRSYTCQVTGYRIPLFSKYPNLIGCTGSDGRTLP